MDRSTSRTALFLPLVAALGLVGGCGQGPAGTTPARSEAAAGSEATVAGAATAQDASGSTAGAGTTSGGAGQDAAEDTDDDESAAALAGQPLQVADRPEWMVPGQLLGVYDGLALVAEGRPAPGQAAGPGPVTVTAYQEDGSASWTRELTVPAQLAGAGQLGVDARPGHRHVLLTWSGTPAGSDQGLVVVAVVDPATGEDVATGEVGVPAGEQVSEQLTYDEFWLQGGSAIITVAADGTLTLDEGADGYDEPVGGATWRITHDLGVLVGPDGRVQLVDEAGPVGEGGTCAIPAGPGVTTASALSPDRDLALLPGVVVDLVGGSVTCVDLPEDQTRVLDDTGVRAVQGEVSGVDAPALLGDLFLTGVVDGVGAFATS